MNSSTWFWKIYYFQVSRTFSTGISTADSVADFEKLTVYGFSTKEIKNFIRRFFACIVTLLFKSKERINKSSILEDF